MTIEIFNEAVALTSTERTMREAIAIDLLLIVLILMRMDCLCLVI